MNPLPDKLAKRIDEMADKWFEDDTSTFDIAHPLASFKAGAESMYPIARAKAIKDIAEYFASVGKRESCENIIGHFAEDLKVLLNAQNDQESTIK